MEAHKLTGATLECSGGRTQSAKLVLPSDLESGPNGGSREKGGESASILLIGEEEFDVKWDGPEDPRSPRSMDNARKWVCTLVVSLGSLCV